jgi:hypothetical protein
VYYLWEIALNVSFNALLDNILDWKGMCEKAWKVNSVKAYITNDDTFF